MNILNYDNWPLLLVAGLTAIFGVGRLVRVIIFDAWPPTVWLRVTWQDRFGSDGWAKILLCPWCLTPWIMAVCIGWFLIGNLVLWIGIVWWVIWGWLALSYVASIVIAYDERD